jgi:hypothetical protein
MAAAAHTVVRARETSCFCEKLSLPASPQAGGAKNQPGRRGTAIWKRMKETGECVILLPTPRMEVTEYEEDRGAQGRAPSDQRRRRGYDRLLG